MEYLSGLRYDGTGFVPGWAAAEHGILTAVGDGRCPENPAATGLIVPELVDAHTHCADAGVKVRPGMTLEELVAPPDGLKHVYLRTTPPAVLARDIGRFTAEARTYGIGTIVDFREGGAAGARLLRQADPTAVILARPAAGGADPTELREILATADGLAVSSLTDLPYRDAEACAEAAHAAGKLFAVHVSERVREDLDPVLALAPDFVVHMCEATDGDLRTCTDAGVPSVVCPRSNRFFGRVPPLARMKKAGCEVALGTDNAMLCSPDLRPEAALAAELLEQQG
ncbi:MAG: amidohydrolase family protein, partial [Methanomethylophilus sp.]